MEDICGGNQPYLSEGHLDAEHLRIRDKAIFQVSFLTWTRKQNAFFANNSNIVFALLPLVYFKAKIGRRRILPNLFDTIGKRFGGAVYQF